MRCRQFQDWIEDEASGLLGERQRRGLGLHCEECAPCRALRQETLALTRDLALVLHGVPEVDVRARVMRAVAAEAEAAVLRAQVGVRAFWAGMAASFTGVFSLLVLARRAAFALPEQALPLGHPLLRLVEGLWTALSSTVRALFTVLAGLLEAAAFTLRASDPWLPLVEASLVSLLALVLTAAAFPLARALSSGPGWRRMAGRE